MSVEGLFNSKTRGAEKIAFTQFEDAIMGMLKIEFTPQEKAMLKGVISQSYGQFADMSKDQMIQLFS